ncbi:hypothetical protein [Demequina sp.]|uniref:hypothetical protein n=1 Tax=Demequina sp. TaxID=2050685 RepID=UPI0025B840D1|nr:hypothetical protein [Demequina sp.]
MRSLPFAQSKFARFAATAAIAGIAVVGSSVTASAVDVPFGAKNCYNYYVMLWATSSGTTEHFHVSSGGGAVLYDWTTSGYHLSSAYKSTSAQMISATGSLQSPGNGCDY